MTIQHTYKQFGFGKGVREHGRQSDPDTKRSLFDRKLVRHGSNTIAAIIHEIDQLHPGELLSLQRLSTVPVEKLFGITRLHAKTHQTLSGILKALETDQVLRLLHATREVRKRKLAYGEVVAGLSDQETEECQSSEPLLIAEALLHVTGFPITNCMELRSRDDPLALANTFLAMYVLPFIPDSGDSPTRRSLQQELLSVMPTARHVMLTAKAQLHDVMTEKRKHWIEQIISDAFGRSRTSRQELITLTRSLCDRCILRFHGRRCLSASRKVEILEWMEAHWDVIHENLDYLAITQRES
jgi:hypothetical protein